MVYVHCRTATNNLGKRFDPPPLSGNAQIYPFFLGGASLRHLLTGTYQWSLERPAVPHLTVEMLR